MSRAGAGPGAGSGLAELPPRIFPIVDRRVQAAERRAAARGLRASCRKGCAACCRYLVRLTIPEALWLARVVDEMPESDRTATRERFAAAAGALEAAGLAGELLEDMQWSPGEPSPVAQTHELSRRYLAAGLVCPLLADEACGIHPSRPLICRRYLVATPAALCADPFHNNVYRLPLRGHVEEALAEWTAERLGEPCRLIALPLALDAVAGRPEWSALRVEPAAVDRLLRRIAAL